MTDQDQDAPELIFFRKTPKELLSRPPLASSLQNLETSFILIALERYPHALIFCASAIESALKAALNCGQNQRLRFEVLIKQAQHMLAPKNWTSTDIDDFRKRRNDIIHYGFSPKDDEICAELLLETGLPFITDILSIRFGFNLGRDQDNYGALFEDLDKHFDIAKRIYQKTKEMNEVRPTFCFIGFAHYIRWKMHYWGLSDYQIHVLNKDIESGSMGLLGYQGEGGFGASWRFTCPICYEFKEFVAQLDECALADGRVRLQRGECANCSFAIPSNCPFLADELCKNQIGKATPEILKEYGIAEPLS